MVEAAEMMISALLLATDLRDRIIGTFLIGSLAAKAHGR